MRALEASRSKFIFHLLKKLLNRENMTIYCLAAAKCMPLRHFRR